MTKPFGGLNKQHWSFDEMAVADPGRAAKLEHAGTPPQLLTELLSALRKAIESDRLRVAREHKTGNEQDHRAVLQFHVGTDLFDWFFNARTGYRAHFRKQARCGHAFNAQIVESMRTVLLKELPDEVPGYELFYGAEKCKTADIPKAFLVDSLVPELSKVWFCGALIEPDGTVIDLALGVAGPSLILDTGRWEALCPEDGQAWLDLKGAFLGPCGPYQHKLPSLRARRLHRVGTA